MTTAQNSEGVTVHFLGALTLHQSTHLHTVARSVSYGDEAVLTTEIIDANRDRLGRCALLDLLDDEDAQVKAWGSVKVRRGPWPAGLSRVQPGSPARLGRQPRRRAARRRPAARSGPAAHRRRQGPRRVRLKSRGPQPHPRRVRPPVSSKGESYAFRDQVVLALHDAGFTSAHRPGEPRGRSAAEKVRGDVLGLPVTIAVRNTVHLDLSGALREAQREAHAEGHELYVSVQSRRGHPVENSFVTTDLATWLRMLARLHPEAVTRHAT